MSENLYFVVEDKGEGTRIWNWSDFDMYPLTYLEALAILREVNDGHDQIGYTTLVREDFKNWYYFPTGKLVRRVYVTPATDEMKAILGYDEPLS